MYRDIPDDLRALIEPVVEDHGFELMDVEMPKSSSATSLRITIDTPMGDGRVPVDDLVRVSRELETQFDVEGGTLQGCALEVSSPGLDRMLSREKDFANACGREIKLTLRNPIAKRRHYRGLLSDFKDGLVCMTVDGESQQLPYADVEKAHVVYSFTRADFNGARSGAASD